MCYLCDLYGDGGLWYLNPRNYSRHMYKLRKPGEVFRDASAGPESGVGMSYIPLLDAMERDAEQYNAMQKRGEEMSRMAGNQVVPIKDAEKVMDLASPIGLISCLCRRLVRGVDERSPEEFTCMGMGVGMLKWERWPERYKGGVHFVNPDEAKEWLWRMDKRGFVHALMTFGAPYIGGFCQCDYPDCTAIRGRLDFGYGLLKSHCVAEVDYEACSGCGICAQRCQFGALKFEVTTKKANIDQFQCFGCGVCQTACPRQAIHLLDRMSIPALREVW